MLEVEMTKSTLREVLQDVHKQHEEQIEKILRELHAEHEKCLAGVVTCSIKQAIAEAMCPKQVVLSREATGISSKVIEDPYHVDIARMLDDSEPLGELPRRNSPKLKDKKNDSSRKALPNTPVEQSTKDVHRNRKRIHLHALGSFTSLGASSRWDWQKTLKAIMGHDLFDYLIATLILANATLIVIQTEMAARDLDRHSSSSLFRACDLFFTVVFSIELAMRICLEKRRFIFGANKGWNFFDVLVVLSALVEEFLSFSTNTTATRVFRILRLVRVIRVFRTLSIFKDLRNMVKGIMNSIVSLMWALVLLFMILGMFSIPITQVVTGHRRDHAPQLGSFDDILATNFGSVLATMYSLYKAITGGDDWSQFADPLFELSTTMGIFFCLYTAFSIFAVLNVITGIFVDNAIQFNQQDADMNILQQTEARKRHNENFKRIFKKADVDASGTLDIDEFQEYVDNPHVQAYFRQLDLEIEGETAKTLFKLLDFDLNGSIDIDEFLFGCGHLRGYARSLDLARMNLGQRKVSKKLLKLESEQKDGLDAMQRNFTMIRAQLGALQQMYMDSQSDKKLDRQLERERKDDLDAMPKSFTTIRGQSGALQQMYMDSELSKKLDKQLDQNLAVNRSNQSPDLPPLTVTHAVPREFSNFEDNKQGTQFSTKLDEASTLLAGGRTHVIEEQTPSPPAHAKDDWTVTPESLLRQGNIPVAQNSQVSPQSYHPAFANPVSQNSQVSPQSYHPAFANPVSQNSQINPQSYNHAFAKGTQMTRTKALPPPPPPDITKLQRFPVLERFWEEIGETNNVPAQIPKLTQASPTPPNRGGLQACHVVPNKLRKILEHPSGKSGDASEQLNVQKHNSGNELLVDLACSWPEMDQIQQRLFKDWYADLSRSLCAHVDEVAKAFGERAHMGAEVDGLQTQVEELRSELKRFGEPSHMRTHAWRFLQTHNLSSSCSSSEPWCSRPNDSPNP